MFTEESLSWAKDRLLEVVNRGMIAFCVERRKYTVPGIEGWTRDVVIISLGSGNLWTTISVYEDGSCDIECNRYEGEQAVVVSYEHYRFQVSGELSGQLDRFVEHFLHLVSE